MPLLYVLPERNYRESTRRYTKVLFAFSKRSQKRSYRDQSEKIYRRENKSRHEMLGQAMMASVLEAWTANDDASRLPFDAKITRRYADDLGEVIEVTLLGEKTVLPIFRNERCPIILQILNSSMTNRNADQVGRIQRARSTASRY